MKKLIPNVLTGVGIFFALGFVSLPAYANCDASTPQNCLSFNATSYFVDHGALIKLNDSGIVGVGSTTVSVAKGGSSVLVTLTESPASSGRFSGYVYFNNAPGYSNTPPLLAPALDLGLSSLPVTVTASYDARSLSATTDITILNFDNTGNSPAWPSWSTNSTGQPPRQPANPGKINCPTGSSDTDGDLLCDSWENKTNMLKIPWPANWNNINPPAANSYVYNCGGAPPPGADSLVGTSSWDPQCPDPNVKDVYVEIDYMKGHTPDMQALRDVITAFKNAPLPAGCSGGSCTGIKLHIQVDEEINLHQDAIGAPDNTGGGATDFDKIKKFYFGTLNDRAYSGALAYQPFLSSKKQAFHYDLLTHAQTGNTRSGISEQPGNDLMISLGDFTGGIGSVDMLEGTLMHELGHNLGLDHGGNEAKNCKPNYLSVMSYSRQDVSPVSNRALNYSGGQLRSLLEIALKEFDGVGSGPGGATIAFGYNDTLGNRYTGFDYADGNSVNWDQDMVNVTPDTAAAPPIGVKITNFPAQPRVLSDCTESSIMTTPYSDFNDWTHLNFNFKAPASWSDTWRAPVYSPTGNLIFNMHAYDDKKPSQWKLDYINATGVSMKPYKLHPYKLQSNELSADDLGAIRSLVITSIQHKVDKLPSLAFINPSGIHVIDDDLISADKYTKAWALNDALKRLVDAENDFRSSVDPSYQAEILSLLHNAQASHQESLVTYMSNPRPTIMFDNMTYNIGQKGKVTVYDSSYVGNHIVDIITVKVFSDSDLVGLDLSLLETGPDTGVFQDLVKFVNTGTNPPNELYVSHGDVITTTYSSKSATAHIT